MALHEGDWFDSEPEIIDKSLVLPTVLEMRMGDQGYIHDMDWGISPDKQAWISEESGVLYPVDDELEEIRPYFSVRVIRLGSGFVIDFSHRENERIKQTEPDTEVVYAVGFIATRDELPSLGFAYYSEFDEFLEGSVLEKMMEEEEYEDADAIDRDDDD